MASQDRQRPSLVLSASSGPGARTPLGFIARALRRFAFFLASLLYAVTLAVDLSFGFFIFKTPTQAPHARLEFACAFLVLSAVLGLLGWKAPRLVWSALFILLNGDEETQRVRRRRALLRKHR